VTQNKYWHFICTIVDLDDKAIVRDITRDYLASHSESV